VNFGEFVEIVCTICLFEVQDLLKYVFYILDREKGGWIDKIELRHFIKTIYGDSINSNVLTALEFLDKKLGKNTRPIYSLSNTYTI